MIRVRPPLQNRNFSITVTRVTVEIDKNEARIRVPRIEKPLATSFCEKIKKNSTGPVFRTIAKKGEWGKKVIFGESIICLAKKVHFWGKKVHFW
jgi:hypothetical protein